MKKRCYLETSQNYADYGGRGITVCDRWLGKDGFSNFLVDMGPRPSAEHSLDRYPENDGNYEPGNCRWATKIQQARNRRSNVRHEFRGQQLTVPEISEITGVPADNIHIRLRHDWSIEDAATACVQPRAVPKRWWFCLKCFLEWRVPLQSLQKKCPACDSSKIARQKK